MQFFRFRNSIVVRVNPKNEVWINFVLDVNDAITIPSVFSLVKLGERKESVRISRRSLRGKGPEQFFPVIDGAILIAIKSKARITRSSSSPSKPQLTP